MIRPSLIVIPQDHHRYYHLDVYHWVYCRGICTDPPAIPPIHLDGFKNLAVFESLWLDARVMGTVRF